jgi:hypothetical protein
VPLPPGLRPAVQQHQRGPGASPDVVQRYPVNNDTPVPNDGSSMAIPVAGSTPWTSTAPAPDVADAASVTPTSAAVAAAPSLAIPRRVRSPERHMTVPFDVCW